MGTFWLQGILDTIYATAGLDAEKYDAF